MAWTTRYDDPNRPSAGQALGDGLRRAVLPLLGLFALDLGIGWLITGPGQGLKGESALNAALQATRTPLLDALAIGFSTAGNTIGNISACLVSMALIGWFTRRWWVAILPGIALGLEGALHAATSVIIGRARPEVPQLDAAQPTASFPSGHVGASLSQLLILFLLSLGVRNRALSWAAGLAGLAFVGGLAWSRLYLGMHHGTDVAVGVLNGVVCGLLGWFYLRLDEPSRAKRALANE